MNKATLRMRKWRKSNRERAKENDRRWRNNNLEKARAADREWYSKNREKELERNRQYHKDNRKAIAQRHRLYRHEMTQEEHDLKLKQQCNRCGICRKLFVKTPHIDHCHKTKKNRGLLCDDCNLGLGRFKDNIEALQNAISYLQKYGKKD